MISIPLPFPHCQKCNNKDSKSVHKNCNGNLDIYPSNEIVFCTKCNKSWNVWDSIYYCSCGNSFKAHEIVDSLTTLIEACKIAVYELEMQESAKYRREQLKNDSLKSFLVNFLGAAGTLLGSSLGQIYVVLKRLFLE